MTSIMAVALASDVVDEIAQKIGDKRTEVDNERSHYTSPLSLTVPGPVPAKGTRDRRPGTDTIACRNERHGPEPLTDKRDHRTDLPANATLD
jgi:hypothetical protein